MERGDLHLAKIPLQRGESVSDTYVVEARRWADALVEREYSGPGDTIEAAMWRAERRWGIDRTTFYSLRYRPPREIFVSVYMRLKAAYVSECERQEARLQHELMLTKAAGLNAASSTAVASAEAFLRKAEGGQ